jgi:nitroreductase
MLELTPDQLLSTTRAVRRRLDLTRPVERQVIEECVDLAVQAPSGGNSQGWHFVFVTDPEPKRAIADLYRKSKRENDPPTVPPDLEAVMASSAYLAEHLHEVPVLLVPCIEGRVENATAVVQAVTWASILPQRGASCWPRAPAASAPRGRACTSRTNAKRLRCSGSRTTT